VLGAQDQAVDVPLAQPHRAGIGAARGPGGVGGVMVEVSYLGSQHSR